MAERAPRRRRRRSNALIDIANALLGLLVLGLLVAGGVLYYAAQKFYSPGPVTEETTFVVERGQGLNAIGAALASEGLIQGDDILPGSLLFRAGAWAIKRDATIVPGEYRIASGASMADILREITEGTPITYSVTIPEGFTSWQVVDRLNEVDDALLKGEILEVPDEGSIMPETYTFDRAATRASIVERMQASMAEAVEEIWGKCDPQVCGDSGVLKTPQELVILASIVEKETGVASERPLVAGLFLNRLREGMKLQTDPTIIYGLTKGMGQLEGGITASQKASETAYNTYIIDGLPPTPIANPGRDALEAVAQPADTDFLYMMAVTPGNPADGHCFAATLTEHQANEAAYRRLEREQAAGEDVTPGACPAAGG